MVRNVKLDAYRRMKLWINELPKDASDMVMDKVYEYDGNENIHWFTGILCLELRIAPGAANNYAMLNLKFTETQSLKFQVVYKFCNSDEIVQSDIAMQNDVVKNGIVFVTIVAGIIFLIIMIFRFGCGCIPWFRDGD